MSNKGDIEIEIQVRVENIEPLKEFLSKNAKFIGEAHQIDKYFSPEYRSFLVKKPVDEWLRLRDSDGKLSINYKKWIRDESGKSDWCDEYETSVGEIDTMEKIFKPLGIKPIITVDKTRKIFLYKSFEITLDNIKGLGDFVEMEFKGTPGKKTPHEITDEMVKFLKSVKCGKVLRNYVGYPFQLLFPEDVLLEEYN